MSTAFELARIDLCDQVLADREQQEEDRRWLWQIRRRVLRYERRLILDGEGRYREPGETPEVAVLSSGERRRVLESDPMLRHDHRTGHSHYHDAEAATRWRSQFSIYLDSLADSTSSQA